VFDLRKGKDMSKSEIYAKRDGIAITTEMRGYGGRYCERPVYLVPCQKCGTKLRKVTYNPSKEYLCDYCKLEKKRKEEAIEQEIWDLIKTPKEQTFDKAVAKLYKQVKNFDSYKEAIEIAKKRTERYDSIPEVLVAIELIKLGYSIIPQQKVGRYRVDFAIPAEKLIIEVDGGLYHPNGPKAGRDGDIQLSLGLDWKILHIPAEWISNHIKMLKKVIIAGTSDNREK
jgi:hypothetical protein